MVLRNPYSGPRKLVLAVDVGTTYSGISYCILQPGQIPELHGVTRFPGQERGHGNAKLPSILYYDNGGNVKAAGSEALTMNVIDTAMDEGWMKAEWWKLHLRPKHLDSAHIKEDDIPPLPFGKSAVDILTDFVSYLFRCTKTYIEEHHMGFNWSSIENSIEFIFTHPNGWEGLQQQQYHDAIERAGLVPSTPAGRSRVHLITEGEASLHYCVSSLSEDSGSVTPQGVVIIDAGGGTIDLSMYSMTFNPIACNEVAPAECRLQGSVFVTRRATALLKRKLHGSPHSSDEEMDVLTQEFDQTTKLTISSADEPVYVKVGNVRYNNPQYNIRRGAMKLSGTEIISLFDESIKAIIDAFEQQCKSAKIKITMAFLVGGLGSNEFLWNHLRSHFEKEGIRISRPDNDINKSVANGAALFHIDREKHLVKSRVARATYGIYYSVPVNENDPEHLRRKSQWEEDDASGELYIPDGFMPILRKGDQIKVEREIRHPFCCFRKNKKHFNCSQMEFMCYRGSLTNPRWIDEDPSSFSELCVIEADLNVAAEKLVAEMSKKGTVYYTLPIEAVASFGTTELSAQIAWKTNGI